VEKGFKNVDKDFGDDLIIEIGKANGSKVVNRRRIIHFRYESNVGVIEFPKHKITP
jgi:hypothetical protein